MLIRLYSDLHLSVAKFRIPKTDLDANITLVLAGDISEGLRAREFVERACKQFKYVIYVLGNHEFYGHEMHDVINRWNGVADANENLYLLDNGSVVIDDVKFVGATLWTDMSNDDYFTKYRAQRAMGDFRYIKYDNSGLPPGRRHAVVKTFTPDDSVALHTNSINYLNAELARPHSGNVIVVTHHAPVPNTTNPIFANDTLNGAFRSDCTNVITNNKIDYWFFGHTHYTTSMHVSGTHVISNQRGYQGTHKEKVEFEPTLTINTETQQAYKLENKLWILVDI